MSIPPPNAMANRVRRWLRRECATACARLAERCSLADAGIKSAKTDSVDISLCELEIGNCHSRSVIS